MILTCPSCASRYFVDEAKLPPEGRKVRCAACGETWRAEPEPDPLDLTPEFTPQFAPLPVDAATALDPDLPADALPKVFRQQAQAKKRTRDAVAASLMVLILLAVVFRIQVVKAWPRTAGVYAALKLPVNPLGLTPDNIAAGQGLQNGHAALIVTGAERNIATQALRPAPMRVSVYDKAGDRLLSRVVKLSPEPISPGESRPFTASFLDPPMAGVQVGIDFVFEPPAPRAPTSAAVRSRPAAYRQAAAASEPHLRGMAAPNLAPVIAPQVAKAIPASSPYALPPAARLQAE